MTLEVLISCMHQKDASIIQKTNIQSNVLVINQCNENKIEEFDFKNKKGEICHARMFYTKERGLSKSRNMALRYAQGDICLICDDDEELLDDYPDRIISSYSNNKNTDVLAFSLFWIVKKDFNKSVPIGYLRALKISSQQITFRREIIVRENILFDETLGSGTSIGFGEENKFLYDCLRHNMKLYYVPIKIGRILSNNSLWFKGFTNNYFFNRGRAMNKIMGVFFSFLYALEFAIAKYANYKDENSFWNAIRYQLKGILNKK